MIDRQQELRRLQAAAAEAPALVVMRGRRRVGKSYLLSRSFAGERLVYFQADEGNSKGQLDLLAEELSRFVSIPTVFSDWEQALRTLGEQAAAQPLVVVLDEFQWLLAAEPRLDSIIMRNFDRWVRDRTPVALVLSGSALSMMEQLLEGGKPMYGRAAYRPLLQPFDYRDAALFGPAKADASEKLLRYGVLGGTAQYQVWAGGGVVREVIEQHILDKDEPLFEEPLQLIRGEPEIREPGTYYQVLRAIAGGATHFNEILHRSRISSSQLLTERLGRLATLRYIEERRPLRGNGSPIWSLEDPFFRFWFRYVYPNRSRLQRGRIEEVRDSVIADIDNHMGPVFEQVCRDWAGRHSDDEALADAQEIGSCWTRTHDVEIDLLATDGQGVLAVGSCKWSSSADLHDLERLIELRGRVRGAGSAALYVFARGFHRSLRERAKRDHVRLVSAEELFAEKPRAQAR